MSAISDFANSVNENLANVQTSVDNLVGDVGALKKKIDELQNSPGAITPADQALLDDIQARVNAVASSLDALDKQTEGVVPPTPAPAPGEPS